MWQDMPALAIDNPYTGNFGYFSKLAGEKAQYEAEMKRMIEVRTHATTFPAAHVKMQCTCNMMLLTLCHHAATMVNHVFADLTTADACRRIT